MVRLVCFVMALIVHVSVFVLLLAHLIVMAQLVVVIIVVVAHLFVVDGSPTLAPLKPTALLDRGTDFLIEKCSLTKRL